MVQIAQDLEFLPPANEVWGKVIFSEACVKNSVHGGVCLVPGGPGPSGDGGCLVPGAGVWRPPPGTATTAGDTHPSGMHSCVQCILILPVTFYIRSFSFIRN